MVPEKLSAYIKSQRDKNISDVSIRLALLTASWKQDIIDEAMRDQQVSDLINTPTDIPKTAVKKFYLLYFLAGLFFNILGAIVCIFLIVRSSKLEKKPKSVSLALGFVPLLLLFVASRIWGAQIQNSILTKYPEMEYVPRELQSNYPGAEYTANISFEKDLVGDKKSLSTISVGIISNQEQTSETRKIVGMKVCGLLSEHSASYDRVKIEQIQRYGFAIFSYTKSKTEDRTCEEWNLNPAI